MKEIFQETSQFIYSLAAKRIYSKKKSMDVTYYILAGYADQIDYEQSIKKTGYDHKMINKIALGKTNRNNRYLIPDMYVDLLTDKLEFKSKHDLLWGDNEEIKKYAPILFEHLLSDCLEEGVEISSNILSLLSNFGRGSTEVTSEKVATLLEVSFDDMDTVEDRFVRLFTDFTYNKYYLANQVENEGVFEFIKETKLVTSFNDAEYLTFKKLPQSIELFAANVFSSFIMSIFLSENLKEFSD
ncbi:hypothetical protein [Enterococcus casseliflavus]